MGAEDERDARVVRRALAILFKVGITLALFWWILQSVDVAEVLSSLGILSIWAVISAIGILLLQAMILAWRWRRVVSLMGAELPAAEAVKLLFLGMFFNQALPTSVGGDIIRAWGLQRSGLSASVAFGSVAVERGTGIVLLGLLVTAGLPWIWKDISTDTLRILLLLVGPSLLVGLLLAGFAAKYFSVRLPAGIRSVVLSFSEGLSLLLREPRALSEISLLGILASLSGLFAAYIIGTALGLNFAFPVYITLVGGAVLLSVLPISFGGWGIREASIVSLFEAVGASPAHGLALSIAWGLLTLLASLPGGLLWWFDGDSVRRRVAPRLPS